MKLKDIEGLITSRVRIIEKNSNAILFEGQLTSKTPKEILNLEVYTLWGQKFNLIEVKVTL